MNRSIFPRMRRKESIRVKNKLSHGQLTRLINNKLDEIEKSAYEIEKL